MAMVVMCIPMYHLLPAYVKKWELEVQQVDVEK